MNNSNFLHRNLFCIALISFGWAEMIAIAAEPNSRPQPGYKLELSGDFDVMMNQAPILDPTNRKFHEGNARFWRQTIDELAAVNNESISPKLRSLVASVEKATSTATDARELAQWMLKQFEAFKPENRADTFQQKLMILNAKDLLRLTDINDEVDRLGKQLNIPIHELTEEQFKTMSKETLAKLIAGLEAPERDLRLTIFNPTLAPENRPEREAFWRALNEIRNKAQSQLTSAAPSKK